MAGAGIYLVGKEETYKTIQAALDQLVTDQGASAFTATQEIVINDSFNYAGARVSSTLNPTSTYRLIIRPGTGQTPTIYGKKGATKEWSGIYIDQVDYVTIQDLKVDSFKSGIIFYQSDYGSVLNCQFDKNDYYCVQLFESNRAFIFNNTMANSSACITILRSNEAVLVHNTVYSGIGKYCVWADWADGPVLSPTLLDETIPIFYSYNNIFYGTTPLIMPLDVQRTLKKMDGNIYYSTNRSIAILFQNLNDVRVDTVVDSIVTWRKITSCEASSTFQDPHFVTLSNGKASPELTLEDNSPVLNSGLSISALALVLPSWLDLSPLGLDIDGDSREAPTPTPGNLEYTTGSDYDLFLDFIGATSEVSIDVSSEIYIYGTDRAVKQLKKSVEPWFVTLASGFFYAGDAAFYLYSSKFFSYLEDTAWSKVELDYPMDVLSAGIENTSSCGGVQPTNWMQQGKTVWVSHSGASLSTPLEESVRVYGTERYWDSSDQAFTTVNVARYFSVKENAIEYYLSSPPKGTGPIVVTDDSISNNSSREIVPFEFRTEYDKQKDLYRLYIEGEDNLFEDPHFHYGTVCWNVPTSEVDAVSSPRNPLVGERYLRANTTQTRTILEQDVYRRDLTKDAFFSFYLNNCSTGTLDINLDTYDEDGNYYSTYTKSLDCPEATSNYEWQRYALFLRNDPENLPDDFGAPFDVGLGTSDLRTLDYYSSKRVRIYLSTDGAGDIHLDAMQFSEGSHLKKYAGVARGTSASIEYDSSDYGVYVARDLSISPIINPQHTGFVTIGQVPATQLDTSARSTDTTLTDTYPPLRSILPWAKINGPKKLRGITTKEFSIETEGLPREVGLLPSLPVVNNVECRPNPIVLKQGGKKTFAIFVTDKNNNPYSFEDVTITVTETSELVTGNIGIREMGSMSKLGPQVTTKSDPSGVVVATYLAQDPKIFNHIFETSDLSGNTIETEYSVSQINHGNLTVVDPRTGVPVSLVSDYTSEILTPTVSGRESVLTLTGKPTFNSVTVRVSGTSDYDLDVHESLNRKYSDGEFYVDYLNGKIYYSGSHTEDAYVQYKERLMWRDSSNKNLINVHHSLSFTSEMLLRYDVEAGIHISTNGVTLQVPVTLTNPDI